MYFPEGASQGAQKAVVVRKICHNWRIKIINKIQTIKTFKLHKDGRHSDQRKYT